MGGRRHPRCAPGGAAAAEPKRTPSKKGTRRRVWGVRLTEDMLAKLEAAFATMPAGKTTVVAYLMDATGATRSNVRTWLRHDRQMPRLGRPTFFTAAEEAKIAQAMELWTASGGLLTREMLGTLLKEYVADMGPVRAAQAKGYFGDDLMPGSAWFAGFLRRRPELRRVKAAGLDEARARAATPEAVAKYFAALTAVTRQYGITSASQVFNTDESMINVADVLRGCGKQAYTTSPTRRRADFVTPVVQSGADAASLVACICADGTRLPLFSVVRGSGGRLPYAQETRPDGTITKNPLASFLGVGAEVHRRENPGFDGDLWLEYARFLAKHLGSTQPTKWKLLLMDGCKVHLSAKGLGILKEAKVVVLMFPSHLSHLLQPCDDDPFLKVKAHAFRSARSMLPTLPVGSSFTVKHLMLVMAEACLYGLSSVHVINGFMNTGAWPVDASKVDVARLLTGMGAGYVSRRVDLKRLMVRLGPEARREMDQPVVSFGSISNRGRAIVATSDGVLAAINELDAAKEAARKAKEARQARTSDARVARAALKVADERDADKRRQNPSFIRRKNALRSAAKRQRDRLGCTQEYTPAAGAVVVQEPVRKRARRS